MSRPKISFSQEPKSICPFEKSAHGFIEDRQFEFNARGNRLRLNIAGSGIDVPQEGCAWSYVKHYEGAGTATTAECYDFILIGAVKWFDEKGGAA